MWLPVTTHYIYNQTYNLRIQIIWSMTDRIVYNNIVQDITSNTKCEWRLIYQVIAARHMQTRYAVVKAGVYIKTHTDRKAVCLYASLDSIAANRHMSAQQHR